LELAKRNKNPSGFSFYLLLPLLMLRIFILCILFSPLILFAQQKDEIRKSIYFDGGSFEISEDQVKELNRWLDSIPHLTEKFEIQLISHTDPIGGKRYNEWLSKMRSESVHGILIQKKIPEEIIHRKDWGLENPVYSNDSYKGMVMNRRVDVILHPVLF
jgi:outer membrane protein OmpA-like peptidoglycan-associated protein